MVVIAGGDRCLTNGPEEQVVPTKHVSMSTVKQFSTSSSHPKRASRNHPTDISRDMPGDRCIVCVPALSTMSGCGIHCCIRLRRLPWPLQGCLLFARPGPLRLPLEMGRQADG